MRAGVLGVVLVVAGAWAVQHTALIAGGPSLSDGVLAPYPIAVAVMLTLVFGAGGRLRLPAREQAAIYLICAAGIPVAATGLISYLLPALVTGFYAGFADPLGRYAPFFNHIPDWMVPGRVGDEQIAAFFEGRAHVPWRVWALPLISWAVLVAGLFTAFMGLAGLLRRRWMDQERLRFPLAELPAELVGCGRELLRKPSLWVGMAVPGLLFGMNGVHHYFLLPGEIPTDFNFNEVMVEEPWRAMVPFTSRFEFEFSPLLIGVVYFMSIEIAFSTWFFFLMTRIQLLTVELLGRSSDEGTFVGVGGQWREWPNFLPHLRAQARGGLLVLAVLSLWAARHSLRDAWQGSAQGRRWVTCFGLGCAIVIGWGIAAGLPPIWSFLHCLFLLLMTVGATRLRVDGGLPLAGVYLLVPSFFYFATGTGPGVFTPETYVAFAFLALISYSALTGMLALNLEGERILRVAGSSGATRWLVVGVATGALAGSAFSLATIYEHGMFSLDQNGGARGIARIGRYVQYLYAEAGSQPGEPDIARLMATGFGALIVAGMSVLRQFFLRLPFHPAGFVYGTGFGTLIWSSALIGWGLKVLIVRYGGAASYHRRRPFFLGLILGELVMRSLWAALSVLGPAGSGFDW
ncbi:MAG: DUF6785 family protein [Candidatus Latescibacterota bacterium]|nr:DUF6785 family protein [Candidatus Latescibacterota bacterium]